MREHVLREGVRREHSYVWWALLQGSLVGGATFLVADHLDLPAPTVLTRHLFEVPVLGERQRVRLCPLRAA